MNKTTNSNIFFEIPINKFGAKRVLKKIKYSEYDFIRELFGNAKKNITKIKLSINDNNGYELKLWWNDGGCNKNDKEALSQLCKSSSDETPGNNGLGIRNAMTTILPNDSYCKLITKDKDSFEYMYIKGIEKITKWQNVTNNYSQIYNNISNGENGTLWIFKLKKEIYENFKLDKSNKLIKVIKRLCCKKIKNGLKIYYNNNEIKIKNYMIPTKLFESNRVLELDLIMGKILKKGKSNAIWINAFKIMNYESLKKQYKILPEVIPLEEFKKPANRTLSKIKKNIEENYKVLKFEKYEGSECKIQITNLFNNGLKISKKNADKLKKLNKGNELFDEINKEYNDLIGINLCLNDIFILEKPDKTNLGNSKSSNHMGIENRFVGIVNINSSKIKDFYYTTPSDKHTSRTNNKGNYLHKFMGHILYKTFFNPDEFIEETKSEKIKKQKKIIDKLKKQNDKQSKIIQKQNKDTKNIKNHNTNILNKLKSSNKKILDSENKINELKLKSKEKDKLIKSYEKSKIDSKIKFEVWIRDFGNKFIGNCFICQQKLTLIPGVYGTPSCSHIIAESKNGPTIKDNLLFLCVSCNSKCGTKNMQEFIKDEYEHRYDEFTNKYKDQLICINKNKTINIK